MQRSRRRAPKLQPTPLKARDALQEVTSYCISCGSRNVVSFRPTAGNNSVDHRLIKCRSCGVISPDFSQPKPRSGVSEDFIPPEKARVHEMADQVLDAFTHQRIKLKLQRALAFAQGDLGLLCHKYLPIAIEVFAHVVSRFGFTDSIDGVMESVHVMQNLAKDDDLLVQKLIRIRKLLTPTGNWIQEDADAEKDDERCRELEQQVLEQKREEERRKEQLALENAKKARLRAKKIAMGLDPSVERPPVLVDAPPPNVAAIENARLELRVNAKFVQKFQWSFNGRAIEAEEFVSGINRCTLRIPKLTKRVTGEYFCTCENEEGAVSTTTCRVSLAALKLSRIGSKPLGTLLSSPMYSCEKNMLMTCAGGTVNVCDAKALTPVRAFPALPAAMEAIAWSPHAKLVVACSTGSQQEKSQIYLYSPGAASTSDISPTVTNRRRNNSNMGLPPSKPKAPSFGSSLKFQLVDVQSVDSVTEVRAAEFLDNGRTLLVSDMMHCVVLYDLSPTFRCRKTLSFGSDVVCHVAACPSTAALFVLAFRGKSFINLYNGSNGSKTSSGDLSEHRIDFKFPVHRATFDASGYYLATAETGFMKTWISVVSVNTKKHSSRRFVAHAGRLTGLQWTMSTSLIISSSHDGYVKVWDPVATSNLLSVHIDAYGIHSMLLVEDVGVLVTQGFSDCRLQSRSMVHLPELEASRLVEMNKQAANIQKVWKGKKTRELIAKYIRAN
ncbi:hypothetical protein PHYSODRAFT_337804 [Phytophthora sojae]|uniref:Protein C10 n=1 Tax=Phytophthora sojae (strain P6497) TaxID=1094619 RepID=G5A293_PHYSP|nr:hypothetical protein PHYSODRAFT_337804 [Phytophthora sojae]EGZ11041.1 hypothetical protein PHYSODRAFT_337804 [Phytophthora sojae]|eukprot:XP_009533786.1 hypothetical protein PHYSODRAFT_337804 [Phytophthora sojae]